MLLSILVVVFADHAVRLLRFCRRHVGGGLQDFNLQNPVSEFHLDAVFGLHLAARFRHVSVHAHPTVVAGATGDGPALDDA